MMNWHPMIVHFPIALFLVGFLLDMIGWLTKKDSLKTAGLVLVVLGALGAGAAVVTGLGAEEQAEAQIEALAGGEAALEAHEEIAIATAWVLGFVALGRLALAFAGLRMVGALTVALLVVYFGLGSVGAGMLALTGHRGGQLVYKFGAGVQTNASAATGPHTNNDDER
jgi:uncharacterized membrane protein